MFISPHIGFGWIFALDLHDRAFFTTYRRLTWFYSVSRAVVVSADPFFQEPAFCTVRASLVVICDSAPQLLAINALELRFFASKRTLERLAEGGNGADRRTTTALRHGEAG
jgi:hypothetical protein